MRFFVGIASTLLLCVAAGSPAFAEDKACERRIGVVGRAQASHAPDFVALIVLTENKAPNIAAALDGSAKSIAGIGAIARELGVPPGDVHTVSAVLENATRNVPRTLGSDQREPDGYRVANRVRVRSADRAKVGAFVGRVIEPGGASIESAEPGLADPDTAEAALAVAAGKDARARAVALAQAAGAEVGVLCSLKAIKLQSLPPVPYPTVKPKKHDSYDSAESGRGKAGLFVPLETGTIDLAAEVAAEFAAQP